ncbi:lysozyme inhibitor LprI family protein [Variovorax ureilyticus]|uniref:Lysozyme inhibitor LprI family protein n=1 Tax=Variovorax ureilyticus TaxID=1836198 RepID=A0ABU8VKG1_9BURK
MASIYEYLFCSPGYAAWLLAGVALLLAIVAILRVSVPFLKVMAMNRMTVFENYVVSMTAPPGTFRGFLFFWVCVAYLAGLWFYGMPLLNAMPSCKPTPQVSASTDGLAPKPGVDKEFDKLVPKPKQTVQAPVSQVDEPRPTVQAPTVVVAPSAPTFPAATGQEVIRPSFDCAEARSQVEQLICSDAAVARLDTVLAESYSSAAQRADDRQELKKAQQRWLREERNRCTDAVCLVSAYKARIADLERL